MEGVVAPVLHKIEPPAIVDKIDVPQLFMTLTLGADGITIGVAVPDPAALVQPFTVWVTV